MRIGSFSPPERVGKLADAGGEYVEPFVTRTLMVGDEEAFAIFLEQARAWEIPAIAFSGLLPAELKIVGPEIDIARQNDYLATMFDRIERFSGGGVIATLGSADARMIPDGYPVQAARDELAEFLTRMCARGADHGVRVNLEHLNRTETNFLNTLRETGEFVREYDIPNLHLVADFFHMQMESEPLDTIRDFGDLIIHAHVADTDRDAPGTGSYPFVEFFAHLRAVGYQGDCSIEAFWTDFDNQVEAAVAMLRAAADPSGCDA